MNEQVITPLAENPNNATCSCRIPTILLVWTLQARNQLNQSCNRVLQHFKIKMMQSKCCCNNLLEMDTAPQQRPNDRLELQHIR